MKKFVKSLGYAVRGLGHMAKTQRNFRIQMIIAAVTLFLSLFARLNVPEFLWILVCIFMVFILESVNTFVETIVDILSPDYNRKAKIVKDVAAGTVLLG